MRRKGSSKYNIRILELHDGGKKYREICEILGCCNYTVYYCLKTNNRILTKDEKVDIVHKKWCQSKGHIRNRNIVDDYLNLHSCIDCGNSDVRVLEFDHVRGKKLISISHAVRNAWNENNLKEEMSKCEIRCANCHRIITIERRLKNI